MLTKCYQWVESLFLRVRMLGFESGVTKCISWVPVGHVTWSLPWFPPLERDHFSAYFLGMWWRVSERGKTLEPCLKYMKPKLHNDSHSHYYCCCYFRNVGTIGLARSSGFPKSTASGQAGSWTQISWLIALVVVKLSAHKNWWLATKTRYCAAKTKSLQFY